MGNLIKIGLALLLLCCLADMPYGYFQFVRFVGMIGFGLLGFQEKEKGNDFFVFWLLSALLINPIFKISLGRELWNIIDIIWAIVLIASIIYDKSNSRNN
jgi:hypothetical protein